MILVEELPSTDIVQIWSKFPSLHTNAILPGGGDSQTVGACGGVISYMAEVLIIVGKTIGVFSCDSGVGALLYAVGIAEICVVELEVGNTLARYGIVR